MSTKINSATRIPRALFRSRGNTGIPGLFRALPGVFRREMSGNAGTPPPKAGFAPEFPGFSRLLARGGNPSPGLALTGVRMRRWEGAEMSAFVDIRGHFRTNRDIPGA